MPLQDTHIERRQIRGKHGTYWANRRVKNKTPQQPLKPAHDSGTIAMFPNGEVAATETHKVEFSKVEKMLRSKNILTENWEWAVDGLIKEAEDLSKSRDVLSRALVARNYNLARQLIDKVMRHAKHGTHDRNVAFHNRNMIPQSKSDPVKGHKPRRNSPRGRQMGLFAKGITKRQALTFVLEVKRKI